ncbi:MAG: hypothetical protein ACXADH_08850, partial [Candidatus Kariarchaeaceae archaeon]
MQIKDVFIFEADFDVKRRREGVVVFPTSDIKDPHLQRAMRAIAAHKNVPLAEVEKEINQKIDELSQQAVDSPVLYETINKNSAEQNVFTEFWKAGTPVPGAPEFDNVTFKRLIRRLRVEYDEFFPMRSFIDKRQLVNPVIRIIEDGTPE